MIFEFLGLRLDAGGLRGLRIKMSCRVGIVNAIGIGIGIGMVGLFGNFGLIDADLGIERAMRMMRVVFRLRIWIVLGL